MENIFRKRKKKKPIAITAVFLIIMLCICFFSYKYLFHKKYDIGEPYSIENSNQKIDILSDSMQVMNMLKSGNYKIKDKKVAYLTFDDGPSLTVTPRILDILKRNRINGTFFLVGNEINRSDKAKEILKRIVYEGNSIGAHTYSHNYKILYPNGRIDFNIFMGEIEETNKLIINELGEKYKTRVIRFPGGSYSWKGIAEVDKSLIGRGYSYIDWNCVIGDAEGRSKDKNELIEIFNETKSKVAGDGNLVILMHDAYGKESTAEALPEIISKLKNDGYEFHTLT